MGNNVVIENPVINSPFAEPISAYFVPIAPPRKRTKDQLVFNTEWTKDRMEENNTINGEEHTYIPDFITRVKPEQASADALTLILEVTGEKKPEKRQKYPPHARSGFPPSTITAASADGRSLKSPTPGTRPRTYGGA